jgi:ribA/ribD-fused uncharacterized protein
MTQRINRGVPAHVRGLLHYAEKGPVYFYGGPFSNFVGGPILLHPAYQGVDAFKGPQHFPNVEVYYQSAKAADKYGFFAVIDAYEDTGDTWAAKAAGQQVSLREDWEEIKYQIMMRGLRAKFSNPELRFGKVKEGDIFAHTFGEYLLSTGTRFIAEDSPTDFVWGIRDESGGMHGRNLLGLALMQVRAELRADHPLTSLSPVVEATSIAAEEMPMRGEDMEAMRRAHNDWEGK